MLAEQKRAVAEKCFDAAIKGDFNIRHGWMNTVE